MVYEDSAFVDPYETTSGDLGTTNVNVVVPIPVIVLGPSISVFTTSI